MMQHRLLAVPFILRLHKTGKARLWQRIPGTPPSDSFRVMISTAKVIYTAIVTHTNRPQRSTIWCIGTKCAPRTIHTQSASCQHLAAPPHGDSTPLRVKLRKTVSSGLVVCFLLVYRNRNQLICRSLPIGCRRILQGKRGTL